MTANTETVLVFGGARSGKSRYAQQLAEAAAGEQIFIATAEAHDDEMAARIAKHIADRGESWTTVEAPLALCEAIEQASGGGRAVLVDCLTLWLSNLMLAEADVALASRRLVETIQSAAAPLILVANEVGMGIVPDTALGRQFRDEQGRLNQAVAAACQRVDFVAAGLPLRLKG